MGSSIPDDEELVDIDRVAGQRSQRYHSKEARRRKEWERRFPITWQTHLETDWTEYQATASHHEIAQPIEHCQSHFVVVGN